MERDSDPVIIHGSHGLIAIDGLLGELIHDLCVTVFKTCSILICDLFIVTARSSAGLSM